jgi:hypothetical protein
MSKELLIQISVVMLLFIIVHYSSLKKIFREKRISKETWIEMFPWLTKEGRQGL